MKILELSTTREYFDKILEGIKVVEYQEIKPNNADKLVEKNEEGLIKVNDNGNVIEIKYDAIRFHVGTREKRDSILVAVTSSYTEILTEYLKWPDGSYMNFETDEEGNVLYYDENGSLTDDSLNGCPVPIRDGRPGGLISEPITYEYRGKEYWRERVAYNLGDILEKDINSKK